MRPLWKGSISFGLVNIPVRIFLATQRKSIKFNYLHGECHSPVQYRKWCPVCREQLEMDDIVRGYEYARGRYIILEEEDLAALPLVPARTVEILDFIKLSEIDPIFYEKSYYLEPADGGQKAYSLLYQTMRRSERIALGRVILRAKESLVAVRPFGDGTLLMETLFYPDEVRDVSTVAYPRPAEVSINSREMEMAMALIERLSVPFDPNRYRDDYREALSEVIEAKLRGEQAVEAPRPEVARVADLLEALRESVRAAEAQRVEGSPPH